MIPTNIQLNWSEFKSYVDSNFVSFKQLLRNNTYYLYLSDGALAACCLVQKNGGSEQTEYEASYQSKANKPFMLTASSPTIATVGVSSAQAVATNANRKGLVLINTSNKIISFGVGSTAVLNSGITLYPGGVWIMDPSNFSTSAINAIASGASSNLSVQEFTA